MKTEKVKIKLISEGPYNKSRKLQKISSLKSSDMLRLYSNSNSPISDVFLQTIFIRKCIEKVGTSARKWNNAFFLFYKSKIFIRK